MNDISWINLVISIGVGVIIIGLASYIFRREKEAMLTKEEHAKLCKTNTKELVDDIKEIIDEKNKNLEKFMLVEIKNKILEELRNNRR